MIDSGTSLNLYVGVTAHRDLVSGEIPGIEKRVSAFLGELRRKFSGLSLHLITPLAEGGDQLAARVALEMDIPIVAVLPMEQFDYEQDFNTDQSLAQFRDLLAASSEVIVMPPTRRNEEMQASGYTRSSVFSFPITARYCWRSGTARTVSFPGGRAMFCTIT